jgi:hypothetical protein
MDVRFGDAPELYLYIPVSASRDNVQIRDKAFRKVG